MRLFRKPIEIKISKLLMNMAMTDASAQAVEMELARQVTEQLKGTWLERCKITVDYPFSQHTIAVTDWKPIPPSSDLTFVWVD